MPEVRIVARDVALIAAMAAAAGLLSNALRSERKLAWIQRVPYDILVPCPEPVGEAVALRADDPALRDPRSLLIDARGAEEFAVWHLPGAMSLPFDWLGPPLDAEVHAVAQQVARSGAARVIVYGDGDDPDSGREWARLLAGARIKNVSYVSGGGPALRQRTKEGKNP